jgi:hypothetical protein
MNFTRDWDYGVMEVVNLFAYRATDPRELVRAENPVGPDNDKMITDAANQASMIIAAWGTRGGFQARDMVVRAMLNQFGLPLMHVIGLTKAGHPRHPLYMPKVATPIAWTL